jgi:serine/threonine-protein phosphatase 2B catalytic subunit
MSATQKHIEKAIGQIQHKDPLPEIDFTQHQLENGFTISTQERVVKEVGLADLYSLRLCTLT